MADKKITLVLEAKNMLSRGLEGAKNTLSGFEKSFKGAFDVLAKPLAAVTAGVMLFKKGIESVEELFNSSTRAQREFNSELEKNGFERIAKSIAKMQNQFSQSDAVFASNNKVMDEQEKSTRSLEQAKLDLEKAKKLSTASSKEEIDAINTEYKERQIAIDLANEQKDIIDEVARKRTESASKEQQAVALEKKARELGKKSMQAMAVSADMAQQESELSFAGNATGYNDKEIESLRKAKAEMDAIANASKAEQEKVLNEVAKLRLESVEGVRTAAEMEKQIEAEKIEAEAKLEDMRAKRDEEAIAEAQERAEKLVDLKQEEVDAKANIEDNAREEQKNAWEKQLRDNEEIARKTVQQFIQDSKAQKDEEKERDREKKIAENLKGMEKRGTKLSPKQKEFLDAFNKIGDAKQAVDIAKQNIEQIELKNVLNKQNDLNGKLTTILEKTEELLKGG
jgi:hypothetical protein